MLDTLQSALGDQLKDLYSAENQLVKALPKMAKGASSAALRGAFESHLEETKNHVSRLEKAGELLGIKLSGKTCKGMEGLLKEGEEVLGEKAKGACAVVDAAIIAAAQRVEHYEIAAYGCARAMAERLGQRPIAALLQETLDEEGAADKKLTKICESEVLAEALAGNGAA
jgi:ferritin-like metal-binding protein YciE